MDNEVEAGTERVCHHIRGPLAGSGKLLNKNAGNTVSETLPSGGIDFLDVTTHIEDVW